MTKENRRKEAYKSGYMRIEGYKPMLSPPHNLSLLEKFCYVAEQVLRIGGCPISQDHFQNRIEQGKKNQLAMELASKLVSKIEKIPNGEISTMVLEGHLVLIFTNDNVLSIIGKREIQFSITGPSTIQYEVADPDYDRPIFQELSEIPIQEAYVLI